MKIIKYNTLMLEIEKYSKEQDEDKLKELSSILASQKEFLDKISKESIKKAKKAEKLSYKEYCNLKDLELEKKLYAKNEKKIAAIISGDYQNINQKRKLVFKRVGKGIALAAALTGLTVGLFACNNSKKDSKNEKKIESKNIDTDNNKNTEKPLDNNDKPLEKATSEDIPTTEEKEPKDEKKKVPETPETPETPDDNKKPDDGKKPRDTSEVTHNDNDEEPQNETEETETEEEETEENDDGKLPVEPTTETEEDNSGDVPPQEEDEETDDNTEVPDDSKVEGNDENEHKIPDNSDKEPEFTGEDEHKHDKTEEETTEAELPPITRVEGDDDNTEAELPPITRVEGEDENTAFKNNDSSEYNITTQFSMDNKETIIEYYPSLIDDDGTENVHFMESSYNVEDQYETEEFNNIINNNIDENNEVMDVKVNNKVYKLTFNNIDEI